MKFQVHYWCLNWAMASLLKVLHDFIITLQLLVANIGVLVLRPMRRNVHNHHLKPQL